MRFADARFNRLLVLKAIRRHTPLARSDLPRLTGLSAGLITQITADLVRRGLLVETREDAAVRRGRPRTRLEINAAGGIVLGVSLTVNGTMIATFVDLAGETLHTAEVPIASSGTLVAFAHSVAAGLEVIVANGPFAPAVIRRVAIALPAIVDSAQGEVRFVSTLPGETVPFAAIVSARLNVPTTIENDMTCMARAEHWFGSASDLDTFSLIFVDLSIGSAAFRDGLPADGIHSELAHVKIDPDASAAQCFCGGRGCLTTTASMYGLARQWGTADVASAEIVSQVEAGVDRLVDAVAMGEPKALETIETAGTHLGVVIGNQINAHDPRALLILFGDHRLKRLLEPRISRAIGEAALPQVASLTRIEFGSPMADWRNKGIAALALETVFPDGRPAPTDRR